jgi:flagellar basal-body rod modification protein FlgD
LADTTAAAQSGNASDAADGAGTEDRFLKLLVAQLNNQDPLNPLDNAQVTSAARADQHGAPASSS